MSKARHYIPGLGTGFVFGTDEIDIEGIKAILLSAVPSSYTKAEADAKYQLKGTYALTGASYTKAEADGKFALTTALTPKLTANKAATQANSTATDVAGLVTDFNALLAKLKTAGLML